MEKLLFRWIGSIPQGLIRNPHGEGLPNDGLWDGSLEGQGECQIKGTRRH